MITIKTTWAGKSVAGTCASLKFRGVRDQALSILPLALLHALPSLLAA